MDTIKIPLTDQIRPIPNIRTRTFFVVKARLDTDGMKTALDTLIREHWRRLGGRLHLDNATGFYEYRVPQTFEPASEYKLFEWSTETKSGSIDAAAPQLMRKPVPEDCVSDSGVAFLPAIPTYDAEFRPSSWPFDFDDSPADAPILYFHLTLYDDATVVAISLPHVVGDQLGTASLVRAWMNVLAGKAPQPMMDEDPLPQGREWSQLSKEEARGRKGRMHVRGTGEYVFVLIGFIPDLVLNKEEQEHVIFLPMPLIKSLRARIVKQLEANGGDPGISDNDVISAVMCKFARIHKGPTTLSLSQSVNLRGRTPKLSGPEAGGFLHNAMAHSSSRFHLSKETPLHEIASQNRKGINEMLTPEGTEIHLAIVREMVRRKQTLHTCEPFEKSYSITSWSAAWKDVDFSPAVVGYSSLEKTQQEAHPVPELFVCGRGGEKTTPRRFHSTVMFRNDNGYWLDYSGTHKNVAAMKAHLATDPNLERL
ncbi:hypothetical protein SCUCBS95973_000991 [Sporothrix curviconia]|uniref:Uncharacterized protein n=1 Tax=Sporothrix curviconia TaxID=1260050 RepID=A0ABP0AUT4_9PEZI